MDFKHWDVLIIEYFDLVVCAFAIDRVVSGTANQPFALRLSPVVWLQVLQVFNVQTDVKIRPGSRGFKILIQLLATDQIWQK